MAYNYITKYTSPNFTKGRTKKLTEIIIHWWGDPANKPTAMGVVMWFLNKASQVSAHYVITGTNREVYHIVDNANTAWHAKQANPFSLGLELDPRCRNEDYDVAAEVIANIWKHYGKLPLKKHSEYVATKCPGNYDLARLQREAEAKLNPVEVPKPAPAPVVKLNPVDIPNKMFITKRETDLWDLSFTSWGEAKSVKKYPAGTEIEISATVDHPLGGRYLLTEYSFNKGIMNGFNVNDMEEKKIVAPNPEITTPVTPPETIPEVPESGSNSEDELQPNSDSIIARIVRQIVELVEKLYKLIKKER